MVKKTYRVDGMSCPNCAMKLESIEDDLPGIQVIFASYQKGRMEVEFDENQVTEAQILSAVTKAGYSVIVA
jgi:copper chaperone CopZ